MVAGSAPMAHRESEHLIALCTCPPNRAADIARRLVESGSCACVNIVPGLRSIYAWKGQIEDDAESLLVIKTRADRFDQLEQVVRAVHPYDVFELVATAIDRGSQEYLQWIDISVQAVGHG